MQEKAFQLESLFIFAASLTFNMNQLLKLEIQKGRVFGLDILRCFAILFVVIGHGNLLLPKPLGTYLDHLVLDGVSIFFVLSGFLIGGILIKQLERNELSFKLLFSFWRRRWFRTLPNYFLVLLSLCALHLIFDPEFKLRSTARFFIFSQNLFVPHPDFFPEAWSLSIEEWFYLSVPIALFCCVFGLRLKVKKALLLTIFGIIVAVTAFRLQRCATVAIHDIADWDIYFRKQVITRLDSLMYGVLGAYLAFYHTAIWLRYKKPLFYFGILLLLLPQINPITDYGTVYQCVFSFSVNALGTLFVIPLLSQVTQGSGLLYKSVTYISLISYSMYLINFSIVSLWILHNLPWFHHTDSLSNAVTYVLFWVLTIVLSILLYKYFELPTTRWRDKMK